MSDWRAIGRAVAGPVPAADLERIAGRLEALEEALRPLFQKLTPEEEPAVLLRLEEDAR